MYRKKENEFPEGDNRSKYKWFQPENLPKVEEMIRGLKVIGEKYGCSTAALSLAWLRCQGDWVNLLMGARKLEHLRDSVRALDIHLQEEDIREMNRLADIANS